VRVRLLAQQLQRACQARQQASVLAKDGPFEDRSAPKSQTLIVPSFDPDTILVTSGENTTDMTSSLWAFVFSRSSTSVPAGEASRCQFWPKGREVEDSGAPESHNWIVP
jgi:hypothetical protein